MLDSVTQETLDNEIHRLCELFSQGSIQETLDQATQLLKRFPEATALYIIAGDANTKLNQFDSAIKNYKKAINLNPDFAVSHFNLGVAFQDTGDFKAALKSYRKAIKINPHHLEAHLNAGCVLQKTGNLNEAIECYRKILKIDANYTEAHFNKALCLKLKGQLRASLETFNKILNSYPALFKAQSQKLYLLNRICDWSELDDLKTKLPQLGITTPSVDPFAMQVMEDHAARTLTRISKYSLEKYNEDPIPLPAKPKTKPNKLRIGYFSADFRDHPVSHQIAKVLAIHDRSKIEVYAYSFKQANDAMQKQIMQSVDHFKDVSDMSEKEIALLARKDNIHIAIDLMGYTDGSMVNIFAFRAAPVQIHIFGGTTGSKFMDYIIADPTAVPDRLKQYYQEKIIYLPHSYMPTDNTREISTKPMTRQEMGLPEDGFVFCCFNNSFCLF